MFKDIHCSSNIVENNMILASISHAANDDELSFIFEHLKELDSELKAGRGHALIHLHEYQEIFGCNAELEIKSESFSISYSVVLGEHDAPECLLTTELRINGVHASSWALNELESTGNKEQCFFDSAENSVVACDASILIESIINTVLLKLIEDLDISQHYFTRNCA